MNKQYFIQRGILNKEVNDSKNLFDLVKFQYMGSFEFEGDSLNKSLSRMKQSQNSYSTFEFKNIVDHKNQTLKIFSLKNKMSQNQEILLQLLNNKLNLKEYSGFCEYLNSDNKCDVNFWWDIENDFFFYFDDEFKIKYDKILKNEICLDTPYIEWFNIVKDILRNKEFLKRRYYKHHGDESVYRHSMLVSYNSFLVAKKLNLNYKEAAIAGLLHDFYYKPWQGLEVSPPFFKMHGFVHASEALDNSILHFEEILDPIICNAIKCHMFPINKDIPKHKISWIVNIVDKYVSLTILKDLKNLPSYIGIRKRK